MIITKVDLTPAVVPHVPQSSLAGQLQSQMAQTEMVFLDHLHEVQASSIDANRIREDLKERLRVIQEKAEPQSRASNTEMALLKVKIRRAKTRIERLKSQIAAKRQAEASTQQEKATVMSSTDAARASEFAKRQDLAYYSQTIECKNEIAQMIWKRKGK